MPSVGAGMGARRQLERQLHASTGGEIKKSLETLLTKIKLILDNSKVHPVRGYISYYNILFYYSQSDSVRPQYTTINKQITK